MRGYIQHSVRCWLSVGLTRLWPSAHDCTQKLCAVRTLPMPAHKPHSVDMHAVVCPLLLVMRGTKVCTLRKGQQPQVRKQQAIHAPCPTWHDGPRDQPPEPVQAGQAHFQPHQRTCRVAIRLRG